MAPRKTAAQRADALKQVTKSVLAEMGKTSEVTQPLWDEVDEAKGLVAAKKGALKKAKSGLKAAKKELKAAKKALKKAKKTVKNKEDTTPPVILPPPKPE